MSSIKQLALEHKLLYEKTKRLKTLLGGNYDPTTSAILSSSNEKMRDFKNSNNVRAMLSTLKEQIAQVQQEQRQEKDQIGDLLNKINRLLQDKENVPDTPQGGLTKEQVLQNIQDSIEKYNLKIKEHESNFEAKGNEIALLRESIEKATNTLSNISKFFDSGVKQLQSITNPTAEKLITVIDNLTKELESNEANLNTQIIDMSAFKSSLSLDSQYNQMVNLLINKISKFTEPNYLVLMQDGTVDEENINSIKNKYRLGGTSNTTNTSNTSISSIVNELNTLYELYYFLSNNIEIDPVYKKEWKDVANKFNFSSNQKKDNEIFETIQLDADIMNATFDRNSKNDNLLDINYIKSNSEDFSVLRTRPELLQDESSLKKEKLRCLLYHLKGSTILYYNQIQIQQLLSFIFVNSQKEITGKKDIRNDFINLMEFLELNVIPKISLADLITYDNDKNEFLYESKLKEQKLDVGKLLDFNTLKNELDGYIKEKQAEISGGDSSKVNSNTFNLRIEQLNNSIDSNAKKIAEFKPSSATDYLYNKEFGLRYLQGILEKEAETQTQTIREKFDTSFKKYVIGIAIPEKVQDDKKVDEKEANFIKRRSDFLTAINDNLNTVFEQTVKLISLNKSIDNVPTLSATANDVEKLANENALKRKQLVDEMKKIDGYKKSLENIKTATKTITVEIPQGKVLLQYSKLTTEISDFVKNEIIMEKKNTPTVTPTVTATATASVPKTIQGTKKTTPATGSKNTTGVKNGGADNDLSFLNILRNSEFVELLKNILSEKDESNQRKFKTDINDSNLLSYVKTELEVADNNPNYQTMIDNIASAEKAVKDVQEELTAIENKKTNFQYKEDKKTADIKSKKTEKSQKEATLKDLQKYLIKEPTKFNFKFNIPIIDEVINLLTAKSDVLGTDKLISEYYTEKKNIEGVINKNINGGSSSFGFVENFKGLEDLQKEYLKVSLGQSNIKSQEEINTISEYVRIGNMLQNIVQDYDFYLHNAYIAAALPMMSILQCVNLPYSKENSKEGKTSDIHSNRAMRTLVSNYRDSLLLPIREIKNSVSTLEVETAARVFVHSPSFSNVLGNNDTADTTYNAHKQLLKNIIVSQVNQVYLTLGFSGTGKCHKRDTPIMMYDGSIKMVQDVKVGDFLMGDDSTPREVLDLGRGRAVMYKVTHTNNNESYVVNDEHILSLKDSNGKVIDIPIKDFLALSKAEQNALKGYQVSVEFEEKNIDNPYDFGKSLKSGKIPLKFKCNSKQNRQKLLDGILDNVNKGGNEVILEENLLKDVIYVARSLGYNWISENNKLIINDLPCESTINVAELPIDDYYGFYIDGNHRYLLGNFIVTHNTFTIKTIFRNLFEDLIKYKVKGKEIVSKITYEMLEVASDIVEPHNLIRSGYRNDNVGKEQKDLREDAEYSASIGTDYDGKNTHLFIKKNLAYFKPLYTGLLDKEHSYTKKGATTVTSVDINDIIKDIFEIDFNSTRKNKRLSNEPEETQFQLGKMIDSKFVYSDEALIYLNLNGNAVKTGLASIGLTSSNAFICLKLNLMFLSEKHATEWFGHMKKYNSKENFIISKFNLKNRFFKDFPPQDKDKSGITNEEKLKKFLDSFSIDDGKDGYYTKLADTDDVKAIVLKEIVKSTTDTQEYEYYVNGNIASEEESKLYIKNKTKETDLSKVDRSLNKLKDKLEKCFPPMTPAEEILVFERVPDPKNKAYCEEKKGIKVFEQDLEYFDVFKQKRFSPNNKSSSRSHGIFNISVYIAGRKEPVKLMLLDMAGKENVIDYKELVAKYELLLKTADTPKNRKEILDVVSYMTTLYLNETNRKKSEYQYDGKTITTILNEYESNLNVVNLDVSDRLNKWMKEILSDLHNYYNLLAEGRFINESLYGLMDLIQQQNLENKIFGNDDIKAKNILGLTNDNKVLNKVKVSAYRTNTHTGDEKKYKLYLPLEPTTVIDERYFSKDNKYKSSIPQGKLFGEEQYLPRKLPQPVNGVISKLQEGINKEKVELLATNTKEFIKNYASDQVIRTTLKQFEDMATSSVYKFKKNHKKLDEYKYKENTLAPLLRKHTIYTGKIPKSRMGFLPLFECQKTGNETLTDHTGALKGAIIETIGTNFVPAVFATFKNEYEGGMNYITQRVLKPNLTTNVFTFLNAESPVGVLQDISQMTHYQSKGCLSYYMNDNKDNNGMKDLFTNKTLDAHFVDSYSLIPYLPKMIANMCLKFNGNNYCFEHLPKKKMSLDRKEESMNKYIQDTMGISLNNTSILKFLNTSFNEIQGSLKKNDVEAIRKVYQSMKNNIKTGGEGTAINDSSGGTPIAPAMLAPAMPVPEVPAIPVPGTDLFLEDYCKNNNCFNDKRILEQVFQYVSNTVNVNVNVNNGTYFT